MDIAGFPIQISARAAAIPREIETGTVVVRMSGRRDTSRSEARGPLANDSVGAEDQSVHVVSQHCVYDTNAVEICQLCLGFAQGLRHRL